MLKLILFGLLYLAQGSPILGGGAVYEARALVATQGIELNPSTLCVENSTVQTTERSDAKFVQTDFEIYPNPAKSVVFLPVDLIGARVQVLDQMGTIIIEREIASSSLDVAQLPSGTYTLRFFVQGKRPQNEKLVIIKD